MIDIYVLYAYMSIANLAFGGISLDECFVLLADDRIRCANAGQPNVSSGPRDACRNALPYRSGHCRSYVAVDRAPDFPAVGRLAVFASLIAKAAWGALPRSAQPLFFNRASVSNVCASLQRPKKPDLHILIGHGAFCLGRRESVGCA